MALIDPLHGSYAYAMTDPKTPSLALNHVFSSSNPPKPANLFLYSYTKTTVKVEVKGEKRVSVIQSHALELRAEMGKNEGHDGKPNRSPSRWSMSARHVSSPNMDIFLQMS